MKPVFLNLIRVKCYRVADDILPNEGNHVSVLDGEPRQTMGFNDDLVSKDIISLCINIEFSTIHLGYLSADCTV